MVAADGQIVAAGGGARAVLRRWFGAGGEPDLLPAELAEWFAESWSVGAAPRFVRARSDCRLEARLGGGPGEDRLLVLQERRTRPPDPAELSEALPVTPRQAEVLALLGEGCSDAEIAHRLGISVRTVGHHVEHILDRLEVSNRTAAAAIVHGALRRST
jgi:DNA-binding CsgD family transcriptional regulator